MADEQPYPLPVFHFSASIVEGQDEGFTEVAGLSVNTEVIEYRDGLSKQYGVRKLAGLTKFDNITLKRGIISNKNEFFEWIDKTIKGKVPERRSVSISLLNEEGSPAVTWKVTKAWPVKVEGPSFNSTGNDVAVESIELAHEGFTVEHS